MNHMYKCTHELFTCFAAQSFSFLSLFTQTETSKEDIGQWNPGYNIEYEKTLGYIFITIFRRLFSWVWFLEKFFFTTTIMYTIYTTIITAPIRLITP